MTSQLYYAPARNYHGKTLVRVTRITTDTRGQRMLEVEAVNGAPWDDAGMFGYSPTSRAKFYPEHVVPVENENAPIPVSALSTFKIEQLPTAILADMKREHK